MVIYNLACKNNHRFEGWFPNYEAYQEQAAKTQISCPTCNSHEIEKLPHACGVLTKRQEKAPDPKQAPTAPQSEAELRELLLRVHHYVKEHFEDVGPQFAAEARAIFGGRSEERPICGTATPEEREELDGEGIPYVALPKPELDS